MASIKQPSRPIMQICKEPTCGEPFTNNNRNSHNTKDFCCSSCSSKYCNREYRREKSIEDAKR